MTEKLTAFMAIVCMLILLVAVLIWVYKDTYYYDQECLKEIAIRYCEENDMTLWRSFAGKSDFVDKAYFICSKLPENPRKQNYNTTERFIFLEEELNGCIA